MKKLEEKPIGDSEVSFELDSAKILAAMKRPKDARKKPTSVALAEATIEELRLIAGKQGIPYQVLIRVFILDGLKRMRESSETTKLDVEL